jgi:hypothetical protein
MDCCKFEEQLSDYLDGLIGQRETSQFAAHALQCRGCRALLDEVKLALRECKTDDRLDTPARLESVLVRIPEEQAGVDCYGFEDLITEILDGYVPAAKYHKFESHADGCRKCSELLTGVVYAVAACHSVHTYEDYQVTDSLIEKLVEVMPQRKQALKKGLSERAARWVNLLLPSTTQSAPWSFTTASMLVGTTFALLLFVFSDDGTVGGIYRKAHLKMGELYSQGADIYSRKDDVAARIEQVGMGIGEVWSTLGGDTQSGKAENKPAEPAKNQKQSNKKSDK